MSVQHTPGPWHVGEHQGVIVYDPNGWAIADAKTFHSAHKLYVAEANARLIAAAPELLAVAEMALTPERDSYDQYHDWHERLKAAAAAVIAKAKP